MTDSLKETTEPNAGARLLSDAAATEASAEPAAQGSRSGPVIEPIDYDAVLLDYAQRPVAAVPDAADIPPRPPLPMPLHVPPRPPLPTAEEPAPTIAERAAGVLAKWRARRAERAEAAAAEQSEPDADLVDIEASPLAELLTVDEIYPEEQATLAPEPEHLAAPEPPASEPEPEPELAPAPSAPEPEPASAPEPVPAPEPEELVAEPLPEAAPAASATAAPVPAASALLDGATPALLVRGLVKRYGSFTALAGIDLTVPAGSFYGIVGPNGAGKTTTLSIISGFLRADAGSVQVAGIDQAEDPRGAKRVMGILPDRLRTFDRLTGRQLLRYYGLLRGLESDVIDQRTADLARAFDLGPALGRVVSDYSAGMTKKLMLAGAMIHSPRLLVLDEPFEAVDPVASGVILEILRTYVDHGGTVILSSHGMDLVERVCSRVAVIVGGDLLAEGTVEELSAGRSLESRFVELTGGGAEVEGLEWLHTFSG